MGTPVPLVSIHHTHHSPTSSLGNPPEEPRSTITKSKNREIATMPMSNSSYLAYGASAIGHLLVVGGSATVIYPRSVIRAFGLTTPTTPESQRLPDSLVPLYGFQEISLGLSIVSIWHYGNTKTLGLSTLAVVITLLGDGWIARKQRKGMEWVHWSLVPVATALAAGLLGYFD